MKYLLIFLALLVAFSLYKSYPQDKPQSRAQRSMQRFEDFCWREQGKNVKCIGVSDGKGNLEIDCVCSNEE